jgi:polysaccharide export outer membrane protein
MPLSFPPSALAALTTLLLFTGCSTEGSNLPPLPAPPPIAQAYILGPGDKLQITVFNLEALNSVTGVGGMQGAGNTGQNSGAPGANGPFTISDTGDVAAPVIGNVKAAGLTVGELEKKIAEGLAKYIRDPNVGVEVLTYRPVFILGEVKTPGSYPYIANMNVRAAVATAGGYTYRADKTIVIVERKIDGHIFRGRADALTPVLPDDEITIPERFF